MALTKVHYLPVFVFILIPSSFLLTYCIAIYLKHVEIGFPYISDTGAYVPESCIFSQLVNIVAFCLAATMYFRYKLIEQHYRDNLSAESTKVLRINSIAIVIGWIGCLGVSVLSNFQETSVIVVHMVGSFIAFLCATLYTWLHSVISYYVCPLLNSLYVARLRVLLSVLISVSFVTTLVAGVIASHKFEGKDPTKWHPKDGGYMEHVISTASEWALVISFDFFILSFAQEMKKIAVGSPQVHFLIEDQELRSADFYNSEDHVAQSQNSLKANSAPSTPYGEYSGLNSLLTIHAVIH